MTLRSGLICVSVTADDAAGILSAVMPVVPLSDVVEIRLDGMRDPRIESCIAQIPCPVLVTNRPAWEGGQFDGSEQERIDLLCQAIRSGARYVDIELRTGTDLVTQVRNQAKQQGARIILSSHDFTGTPPLATLQETLRLMITKGADIGKIVTTATNAEEALRILSLQQEALASAFPLSAFAMGTAGRISRFATLYLGGFMTYAALTARHTTAPGQLSVKQLHALMALFETSE
jgi:3-dehydroquinate dehydratase-1/3-dehydroquinate dehydratase/shikimate dehydrogenase